MTEIYKIGAIEGEDLIFTVPSDIIPIETVKAGLSIRDLHRRREVYGLVERIESRGASPDGVLNHVTDCVLSLDIYDVIESNMQSCLDGTYNASSGSGTDSVCGNDIIESGEACEGINLDDKTCLTEGFTSGTLACSNDCSFDYSTCVSPIKPNITYSNFDGDTTDFDSLNGTFVVSFKSSSSTGKYPSADVSSWVFSRFFLGIFCS